MFIPLVVLAAGVLAALMGASTAGDDRVALSATFLALGQVVGAAAGVVFAVLIFAVEFQVSQAGPLAPMTKFVHRSSGMVPDAAIVIGSTASSVVLSFWLDRGLPGYGSLFQVAVFALTLIALGLVLWHFCRILRDATGDIFTQLGAALVPYMGDVQDEERAAQSFTEEFEKLCKSHDVEVSAYGPISLGRERVRVTPSQLGTIQDVRIPAFGVLVEYLREQCPGYDPVMRPVTRGAPVGTCLLLVRRDAEGVPVLEPDQDEEQVGATAEPAKPVPNLGRIQALVDRAFVVGPKPHSTTQEMGEAIGVLLSACEREAAEGRAGRLGQHLAVLETMVREWSGKYGAAAAMFALVESRLFFYPPSVQRALRGLLYSGIEGGDREVFEKIEMFLHRLVQISEETREEDLGRAAINLLASMYPIALASQQAPQEGGS